MKGGKQRLRLLQRLEARVERFMLRRSRGEVVDGLWLGAFGDKPEPILCRLREALQLIKISDPRRYSRLIRDLKRIWVPGRLKSRGLFNYRLEACELDEEFVLAETPELTASVIVHEATHARLLGCGIGYEEEIRPRVEAICVRRELAFATKLPNGQRAREWAMQKLTWCNAENLSDTARDKRHDDWHLVELRRLGMPNWAIWVIFAFVRIVRLMCWTGRSAERVDRHARIPADR
jgi:hypothetical protein